MAARCVRPLLAAVAVTLLFAPPAPAGPVRTGFGSAKLPAGDDVSGEPADLGFSVNFFGQSFSAVTVNSNGNLSFGGPLTAFSPVPLGQLGSAVVAPFFADVDTTRGGSVTHGTGTIDGRPAFAATWSGVGYYSATPPAGANDFQAVFVDRSDTGAGNFDLEFNYARLAWEAGDFSGGIAGKGGSAARAGFTGGSDAVTYELPGSGTPGGLIDGSPTALTATLFHADTPGRFVFASRAGVFTTPDAVEPGDGDPTLPTDPGGPTRGGVVGAPEPATAVMAAVGVVVVGWRRRRA